MKIYDLVLAIEEENSRNKKEALMKKASNNEYWQKYLYYTYNPLMKFGIIELPEEFWELEQSNSINHIVNKLSELGYENSNSENKLNFAFFTLLGLLADRVITGNDAKELIKEFFTCIGDEDRELFQWCLYKDLDIGINVKTINKVYPNLIPTFDVQLADRLPLKDLDSSYFPLLVEEKFDGVRIVAILKNGEVTFWTRNGRDLYMPTIAKQVELLAELNGLTDIVLDGEVISNDRKSVSGKVNQYLKRTAKEGTDRQFHYQIFDMLTMKEWETKNCELKNYERRLRLEQTLEGLGFRNIHLVNSKAIQKNDKQLIGKMYRTIVDRGGEGLILKPFDYQYEFKRSLSFIKFKEELDVDLVVVDVQGGTGKYNGMIGALVCETEDGQLRVAVGSGLTDADRSKSPEEYIGKVVTVTFNTIIDSKDKDTYSLFLPRFVEVRNDKDIANSTDEILKMSGLN
jgi:DNA ligase-1